MRASSVAEDVILVVGVGDVNGTGLGHYPTEEGNDPAIRIVNVTPCLSASRSVLAVECTCYPWQLFAKLRGRSRCVNADSDTQYE